MKYKHLLANEPPKLPPGFDLFVQNQPKPQWLNHMDNFAEPEGDGQILVIDAENEESPGNFRMQMLRSASHWSIGKKNFEQSIYCCYCEVIEKADRFIYIENQFVISHTGTNGVENKVIEAIIRRIRRAIREKSPFKVIIFLPLMPAFEANLEQAQGKVMQIQIGLENGTLGQGENSLIGILTQELKDTGITPENYVMICGLRTWDFSPDKSLPTTELIYIHSKVAPSNISS